MEPTRDEKAVRLQNTLKEALKPMMEKLEKMEQEIKALQESQEELKNLLAEKTLK